MTAMAFVKSFLSLGVTVTFYCKLELNDSAALDWP
jgi:hypothetical protein